MKVGWLHDDPGYLGGAELTMREFRAAAPEGVEFVDEDADVTVLGNVARLPSLKGRIVQYRHDMQHPSHPHAEHIFCSPLQRKHMGMEGECIPPAIDLDRFRGFGKVDVRAFDDDGPRWAEGESNGHRKGAVCVGRMAYGKGLELLAEYPEPVDVYSSVPVPSEGNARYLGPTSDVAETLSHYRDFVFLPTAIEPFGRAVVEAWAAGLTLVVNKNVGALHYIVNDQLALRNASERFWEVVCG